VTTRQRRWLSLGTAAAAAFLSAQLVGATPASAADTAGTAAARIIYYDASRAAEFGSAVAQGAANWNSSVANVRLEPVPSGRRANVTVYADNGWPRAYVTSLGNGRIYMGRQAVQQGHSATRIAAHEFGHILGLPDRRTGRCSDLMSGSSAPPSCRNAFPSAAEADEVDDLFASGAAVDLGRLQSQWQ
jgi:snapalysin